jgi:uncharacterized protein YbcI
MNEQGQVVPPAETGQEGQNVSMQLSNAMIRLYKELFGRGPTSARTDFVGSDVVVVTLKETLTPAERSLADMGEHQRLRDTRLYFQYATEERFRGEVERIVGRKTTTFISGMDTREDVSVEYFGLEPASS